MNLCSKPKFLRTPIEEHLYFTKLEGKACGAGAWLAQGIPMDFVYVQAYMLIAGTLAVCSNDFLSVTLSRRWLKERQEISVAGQYRDTCCWNGRMHVGKSTSECECAFRASSAGCSIFYKGFAIHMYIYGW